MKIILKFLASSFVAILFFIFSSCADPSPRVERTLGTVCFVNLFNQGKDEYYDEIFDRIDEINTEFNIYKKDADLYRINAASFGESVFVCDDVFKVLQTAQKISALTEGAFDVSIEPLVSLWRINTNSPHVASEQEISELLPLVDFKNILLNPSEKSVRLLKKGMKLDFGGIAKRFAADEVAKICEKHKIRRAVIDLGGNVYVYGKKSKKKLWNVGIKNPEFPDSAPLVKITLPQNSVVTSGLYERFFEKDEKRYHHILSPETGRPVENELTSVTVICANSMIADALTTSFFVLGKSKSLGLIPSLQKELGEEFSAIFIDKNHEVAFSDNFPFEYEILYEGWSVSSDR